MSAQNKIQVQNVNNSAEAAQMVEILYQKMGDRWYAFTVSGDDVFMGSVTEEEINQAAAEQSEIETLLVAPTELHESAEVA
jgi:hypothetical protein